MTSTRLPGKVLRPLLGKPMLEYQLESLEHCTKVDQTVVLTSTDSSDDPVAAYCHHRGTPCFRGDLRDVTARFLAAATAYGVDAFIRLSGDSPLMDYRFVDQSVDLFQEGPCDLATNVLVRTYPKGQSVEAIAVEPLRNAYNEFDADDREHVTPFYYRHPERFAIRNMEYHQNRGATQMAVDTFDDVVRVEATLRQLGRPHWDVPLDEMLIAFDAASSPDRPSA